MSNCKDYKFSVALLGALFACLTISAMGVPSGEAVGEDAVTAAPGDLFAAILSGNQEEVRRALDSGLNADTTDKKGRPGLILAAKAGHWRVAALLLERGAQIDAADRKGRTALFYAVKRDNLELARTLLARDASVTQPDSGGKSPLLYAVTGGSAEMLEMLLRFKTKEAVDEKGRPMLFAAIEKGRPASVPLLLKYGANPNEADAEGNLPFDAAARLGKSEELSALQNAGAKPKAAPPAAEPPPAVEPQPDPAVEEEKPVKAAAPESPRPPAERKTRLRIVGGVNARWEYGKKLELKDLAATIWNSGEVRAKEIVVEAEIPGGKKVKLDGPAELDRNRRADYTVGVGQILPRRVAISVRPACSNCY